MAIYPVNGDGSEPSQRYLSELDVAAFDAVSEFFAREAARYGIALDDPVAVELGTQIAMAPPAPPAGRNPLAIVWWSLRLRWFAWRTEHAQDAAGARHPHVRRLLRSADACPSRTLAGTGERPDRRRQRLCRSRLRAAQRRRHRARDAAHAGRNRQVRSRHVAAALSGRLRRSRAQAAVSAVARRDHGRAHRIVSYAGGDAGAARAVRRGRAHRGRDTLAP